LNRNSISELANLLWSSHDRKVGRTELTISDFVTAGIALVQDDGVVALSMRNLGARLNVRPMAIYSVIPSKQALVALMVDRAYRDLYPKGNTPDLSDWPTGLRQIAHAHRALHAEHPWLLDLAPSRSLMGPWEARRTELELNVLDGTGLSNLHMEQTLRLVLAHVTQNARLEAQVSKDQRENGISESQWWAELTPVLQRVYDPSLFPLILRIGTEAKAARLAPTWSKKTFEFGLERILDGVAVLLEHSRRRTV
jgi:AcrR family transcriptional regulator